MLKLSDLPEESKELLRKTFQVVHSLQDPDSIVKGAVEEAGISEVELRPILRKMYKEIFDEFLAKI